MGAAKNSSDRGTTKARSGESFVAAQRRRQAREAMWRRIGITVAVAVVAIAVGVGVLVTRGGGDEPTTGSPTASGDSAGATPSAFTADGALVVGSPDGPTVSITEDFQCPACRQFEEIFGSTVSGLIADGSARVEYRPVAILDRMSTDNYSSRSAAASACVAEESVEAWPAFKTALFENQPSEGGAGLTDERLVELAAASGAGSQETAGCITDGRFVPWVGRMTEQATSNGLRGTPTVTINGEQLTEMTPDALTAAVEAAGQ